MDRNSRKIRQGYVVSDKMDKTVVVAIEESVRHSLYGKSVKKRNSRLMTKLTNAMSAIS